MGRFDRWVKNGLVRAAMRGDRPAPIKAPPIACNTLRAPSYGFLEASNFPDPRALLAPSLRTR